MIIKLRKRHFLIWILLAILLPTGFILAILDRPEDIAADSYISLSASPLPNLISTQEDQGLRVTLRRGLPHQKQIEIKVLQPIPAPSIFLAIGSNEINDQNPGHTIGKIHGLGTQRFSLDSLSSSRAELHLLFYDKIKGDALAKFKF